MYVQMYTLSTGTVILMHSFTCVDTDEIIIWCGIEHLLKVIS